jgi:RNA polymerase sigma-B factor
MQLREREVDEAREALTAFDVVSLDAPASGQDDTDPQPRAEAVGSEDSGFELAEDRITLGAAIRRLPALEREVLALRYGEDRTQSDIAAQIGVSQMQVSRILRRTLERLQQMVQRGSGFRADRALPASPTRVSRDREATGAHERADHRRAATRGGRRRRRPSRSRGDGRRAGTAAESG